MAGGGALHFQMADLDGHGDLTLFDFLAFFDQYEDGC